MEIAKHAYRAGDIVEVPAQSVEGDDGRVELAAGRLLITADLATVDRIAVDALVADGGDQGYVAFWRRHGDGVPVDQEETVIHRHEVGGVRFAMGDDQVRSGRLGAIGQAVKASGEPGEIGGTGRQEATRGLRERPAVPRAIGLEQEGGQIAVTTEPEDMPGRAPPYRWRGLMQGDNHVKHQAAKSRIRVRAERIGVASHEREDADRVLVIKAAQDLAITCRDRRYHELQAHIIAERGGRGEGALESFEHGLPRLAHPVLVIEIVDRDEMELTTFVNELPVVATATFRHMRQRRGTQAPAVGQCCFQALRHQVGWRATHTSHLPFTPAKATPDYSGPSRVMMQA